MVESRFGKESVKHALMPTMAIVAAAALAIVMGFGLVGCSSGGSSSSSSAGAVAPEDQSSSSATVAAGDISVDVNLTQSVTSPEAPDTPNQFAEESMTVDVADDATALDALKATGREIHTEGEGDDLEVVTIGGLSRGDAGASSYWQFSVNGEVMTVSPAVYTLSNGDKITFDFVD